MRFWLMLLCLVWAGAAPAHPLAPILLELREQQPGQYTVHWKLPASASRLAPLELKAPPHCRLQAPAGRVMIDTAIIEQAQLNCGGLGLIGQELSVSGLIAGGSNLILDLQQADGRRHRSLLTASQPSLRVPETTRRLPVMLRYAGLGIEHLALGLDHLAFVLGLMILVQGTRLLLAVSAFTLGHSLTLGLTALDIISLPMALVELGIALSIALLGAEILSRQQAGAGWISRHPGSMAGAFGLLHGLGFAGALSEIGLPQQELLSALLSFNLGIELAQLGFITLMLGLMSLARRIAPRIHRLGPAPAGYALGIAAAYWCWERVQGVYAVI